MPVKLDGNNLIAEVTFANIGERDGLSPEPGDNRVQYGKVLDGMLEGCQIISYDWRYLYVNAAASRYVNRTNDEMLGHEITEIYPGITETKLFGYLRTCMEERIPYHGDTPLTIPDGDEKWFKIDIKPVPEGILILSLDITKRKQTEEQLKTIAESSPIGVYVIQDGKFRFVNRKFLRDTGYSENELLGLDGLYLILPEDRGPVRENIIRMLKGGSSRPFQYRVKVKNGKPRWILGTVTSINYGGRLATLGNYLDITEQKNAQDELISYRQHLEELVRVRTAQLSETATHLEQEIAKHITTRAHIEALYENERLLHKELQKQTSMRIAFTRALIHELKTPLTPILGASEILMEKVHDKSLQRLAANINRGTLNLKNRIKDLMDMDRGEVGTLQLNYVMLDVSQMLREVVDYLTPSANKKHQTLILNLPDSLPRVKADEERIQQVILNLMNNSLRFTGTKGKITLEAHTANSELIISISDNGPGIAKKRQLKLFEPHYTLETQTRDLDGLGLGLPLCKMLVELHNGKIWVESRKGKGSKFSFTIPLPAK